MDFGYLLELAKNNEKKNKNETVTRPNFSTKISGAKKVEKKEVRSDKIKKFLQRQEDEKNKKEEEEFQKKQAVLDAQSKNATYNKRVGFMLKTTVGANKSVLEETKDLITVGTMGGEDQCDADDYGYESTIGQSIFAKLKDQYSTIPEDDRFKFKKTKTSSIAEIKARVKESLKRKEEEDLGIRKKGKFDREPKKRWDSEKSGESKQRENGEKSGESKKREETEEQETKRKKKEALEQEQADFINDGDEYKKYKHKHKKKSKDKDKMPVHLNITNYKSNKHNNFKYDNAKRYKDEEPEEKVREKKDKPPKSKAPPPMSFADLMKIAQTKQKDPKSFSPLPVFDPFQEMLKKRKEEVWPMTESEREIYEGEQSAKLKRMEKLQKTSPTSKLEALLGGSAKSENNKTSTSKLDSTKQSTSKSLQNPERNNDKYDKSSNKSSKSSSSKVDNAKPSESKSTPSMKPDKSKSFAAAGKQKPLNNNNSSTGINIQRSSSGKDHSNGQSKHTSTHKSEHNKQPSFNKHSSKLKTEPSKQSSSIKSSSLMNKLDPATKKYIQRPPHLPPQKSKKEEMKRKLEELQNKKSGGGNRNRIDSDSEYDSEMDDFIDDDNAEVDYSSEIAKMFKYDKSKFRDVDEDDLSDMEAGFGQVEQEERFSHKMGLEEDLREQRMEEEARKRKLEKKKHARR